MRTSPASLTANQVEEFFSSLSGVRDADVESIHDARVSTRRLRELLPLAAVETATAVRQVRRLVRGIGRALGSVRELDTLIALCVQLADENPNVAGSLALCRAQLLRERERSVRRLVKRLERMDLDVLREGIHRPRVPWPGQARRWKAILGDRLAARAAKLSASVDRAAGVYLPNRLHKVRIQLKKLRYLVEIATATGAWRPAHLRRDAARLQDALGDIHDRQVLLDRLEAVDLDPELRSTLAADIAQRHAQYLGGRARIRAMADACRRFANPGKWTGKRVSGVAAAVLLPAVGALLPLISGDHGAADAKLVADDAAGVPRGSRLKGPARLA